MHHDHLNKFEREPVACRWRLEDELNNLATIEIAT